MDHEGARRLMAEAMEGRLEADDERELALHLVGCEDCKLVYEGLQHANPALTSIQLGEPSTEAVDAAVHRAATVLRGEADPGPMGLTEEPPRLPDELDPNTVRIDSALGAPVPVDVDFHPAGPAVATGPMSPPSGAVRPLTPPEAHVRAIEAEPQSPPEVEPPELPPSVASVEEVETTQPDPTGEFGVPGELEQPAIAPDLPPAAPADRQPTEIESLLEEDRARFEPLGYEEEPDDDEDRIGPGPWLVAIAVTVVLAVLAGYLITRGDLFGGGGGSLPSADQVRRNVSRSLGDMKSLKTAFDIRKLSLYRVGREDDALNYSFSTGEWNGRIDYDRSEGYKQSHTLEVKGETRQQADVVQTADETRGLVGTGDDRVMQIERNPPLGPPDGNFRPTLGILEESLGGAAALLSEAEDLEVLRVRERNGRETYEVRASVRPTELSRADQIEAALDASNFLPVIVKRTITRGNARVLGPEDALTDEHLDTAFGDNDRIMTELLELTNVQYDDIVLPGDLALEAPEGVEEETGDARFGRVTRADLGTKVDFEPLLPRSLSGNYEEQYLAVYTGEQRKWGPGNAYPEPESVFHSQYFNGTTTIAVTQRRMSARFELEGSPLQRTGLPITVRRVERDEKVFFFGTSPEVPPHAYGFLGNVFVMASGYAPQNELVRILASLAETPVDIPSPVGSPDASPDADATPDASPDTTETPAVTASP